MSISYISSSTPSSECINANFNNVIAYGSVTAASFIGPSPSSTPLSFNTNLAKPSIAQLNTSQLIYLTDTNNETVQITLPVPDSTLLNKSWTIIDLTQKAKAKSLNIDTASPPLNLYFANGGAASDADYTIPVSEATSVLVLNVTCVSLGGTPNWVLVSQSHT